MRHVYSLLILGLLTGCATPAKQEAMVPTAQAAKPATPGAAATPAAAPSAATAHPALASTVSVDKIAGGEKTNPLWTSEIDNEAFGGALKEGLRGQGLLASGPAKYHVDASLVKVKQPLFGFTMTVTSTVHYHVTNATGAVLMDEDIVADGIATTGDAFVGVKRLRLANEKSGKANIEAFINRLVTVLITQPPASS